MNELVIVFSAEVVRRLKSRSFMVGLLVGAIGIIIMLKFPAYMDSFANTSYRVVLAGDAHTIAAAKPLMKNDFNISAVRPGLFEPTQADLERNGKASAVVVLHAATDGLQTTVYARDPGSFSLTRLRRDLTPLHAALATHLPASRLSTIAHMPVKLVPLGSKFGTAAQSDQARGIAYVLIILLYLLIVLNSQLIMTSVAEEKTSRIAELLVATVNPAALLGGKIGASAVLAIVQMLVWVAVGFLVGSTTSLPTSSSESGGMDQSFMLGGVPPGDIAGFAIFFMLGYLQMAVMFAAIGSLINRTEDIGSIGGPFFVPVIAALIIAMTALTVPDAPLVVATSFIPLISPFVMFARIVVTSVPPWQIALSLAINLAAIWGLAVLGGKIYRMGMLFYGRTPSIAQIARALRA